MLRTSVLVMAALFSAPVLWQGLVAQTTSVDTAIMHFLIAVPVAGFLLALLRAAMARRNRGLQRRADDD
jgi:hypothetical protein